MTPDHSTRRLLARRLRELRFNRGWSQETLAAQAGLHRNYISGIEREPLPRILATAPCVALPPAIHGGRLLFAALVLPVRHERNIGLDNVEKLADAFSISVGDLLSQSGFRQEQ